MYWWIAIFFVTRRISVLRQDITMLWYIDSSWINSTFRNNCLLWLLNRVLSEFHLCFILQYCIFQDGSSKAFGVPISCQPTQSSKLTDKTQSWFITTPFFAALLHLPVVCNDVSYPVTYCSTCIEIRIMRNCIIAALKTICWLRSDIFV